MHLVDTHCHIHDSSFEFGDVVQDAKNAGVGQLICVGTSASDSEKACDFVQDKIGMWASVGLHPHDAKMGEDDLEVIARLAMSPKVVAIGEFGLDYYYENSPREAQIQAFEYQLQLARGFQKPCIFHVREAFDDFWPILSNFPGIKGVVHSFTSNKTDMDLAVKHGLFLGVNGIATFTKDPQQTEVFSSIPIGNLLLETDSPFLTPKPLRGNVNVPANVRLVAAYLAELRGCTLEELIEATTSNAQKLFLLNNDVL